MICKHCGKEIEGAKNNRRKYCIECSYEINKVRNRLYMQNKNYQKKEQQAKTTRCPKCNETYSVRMITNSGSGNAEYFCSECAIEFRTTKGEMKVWNLSMQGKRSVAV